MNFSNGVVFRSLVNASLLFLWIFLASDLPAQSLKFKKSLFWQGVQSLRDLDAPNQHQLRRAFEAAVLIDSGTLVQPLVEEFDFDDADLLRDAITYANLLPDDSLIFQRLDSKTLTWKDRHHFAEVAILQGANGSDSKRIVEAAKRFLERVSKSDESPEGPKLDQRVIEQVRYYYGIGWILHHSETRALDHFKSPLSNPILRSRVHGFWLRHMGLRLLTTEQFLESLEEITSDREALWYLYSLLDSWNDQQLRSDQGIELSKSLLKYHEKIKQTGSAPNLPDYDFDLETSMAPELEALFLDDKFVDMRTRRVERLLRRAGVLGPAQDSLNPKPVAKTPRSSNKRKKLDDFESKLAEIPFEKQPKWIVNYAMIVGWQRRSRPDERLPEEDKILEAFALRADDAPGVAKEISKCMSSFTPPTDASKKVLDKMMKMLPVSQQLVTKFDFDKIKERIQQSTGTPESELIDDLVSLLKRSGREDRFVEFAVEFARTGNEAATLKTIDRIATSEDSVQALFQCAIEFPPNKNQDKQIWHRPRRTGGVF